MKDILAEITRYRESRGWTEYQLAERAVILPRGFDGFWYPAGLEQSEYLIAGLRHPGSCTASLVRYSLGRQRQGKLTVTLLPLPDGSPCPLPR